VRKEITDSENARAGGQKRSVEQIKEKWRKACTTAKLEAAVNRKSLNQTGEGPALPTPSEELHTDALKAYQKKKGIVLYIFSVLSMKLMSVMDISSMVHDTISFILHYYKNTGTFIKQNNECMLHPFLANYIHPFKIMHAFFKYGIQIHYFKDIC
jgi:hypothetical protein